MRKNLLIVATIFAALLFSSCEGGNKPSGRGENHSENGMYIGITGFNKYCYLYGSPTHRYWSLTNDNAYEFTSFVNSLSFSDANGDVINGTVLYYAIDNTLTYLEHCSFPEKLQNISIITFTDGLDQGSSARDREDGNNAYANNTNTYKEAINKKIQNLKINGVAIDAYAIGLRGSDIPNSQDVLALFNENLVKLSSKPENAMEVSSMSEVNAKFRTIAESLYKSSITTTFKVVIPEPGDDNMPERFTLDLPDNAATPDASKVYIEGNYDKVNRALKNIKYVGCMSSSGSVVKQEEYQGDILFSFENFTDEKGEQIDATKMNVRQWNIYAGTSTWIANIEFSKQRQPKPEIQRASAVAVLLLDCSSSLGADLAKVKAAANDFIKTLANGVGDTSGTSTPSDPTDPSTTDNSKHCWKLSYTYEGMQIETYQWGTEDEIKAGVAEARTEGIVMSYSLSAANDEYSCESMNSTEVDETYYIKHPWGTGADADWTWKQMEEQTDGTFIYVGLWGGVGANINTTASDASAAWFSASAISGASSLTIGDVVKFIYNPSSTSLSVAKVSSGSASTKAQVRFVKSGTNELVIALGIANSAEDALLAYHEFGTGTGTSEYYEIEAGTAYPYAYWLADGTDEEGWYGWSGSYQTYNFQAGKKYTYTLDSNSVSITLDGSANAPAKVIYTKQFSGTNLQQDKTNRK